MINSIPLCFTRRLTSPKHCELGKIWLNDNLLNTNENALVVVGIERLPELPKNPDRVRKSIPGRGGFDKGSSDREPDALFF